ncbi:MAG: hypothetical protein IJZ82_05125 [Lachnospiraceae bacterium]|nr:hypothetical protein [Lachnospiraceae bacterium]
MTTPNYYYKLYGLTVSSELPLQEANELCETFSPQDIDVTIRLTPPPASVLESAHGGQVDYLTEEVMWFYLKDMVLFYTEKGNLIHVWIEDPTLPAKSITAYLLGSAFSLILMQRGILPIHGSSLRCNDSAFIISGGSGSGKSTTTFNMMNMGYDFLSDDISAVSYQDGQAFLHPGPPWQKLCRNIVEADAHPEKYIYIDEHRGKYARKLDNDYSCNTYRLLHMFIITVGTTSAPSLRKLEGIEKLHFLTNNLYRGEIYHRFGLSPQRKQLFLDIISHINMYVITRPALGDSTTAVARLINETLLS